MQRRVFLKSALLFGTAALEQSAWGRETEKTAFPPVDHEVTVTGMGEVSSGNHLTACLADQCVWFRWKNRPLVGYNAHVTRQSPGLVPVNGPKTGFPLTSEINTPWQHHRSMLLACDRLTSNRFLTGNRTRGRIDSGNPWKGTFRQGKILSRELKLGECTGNSATLNDFCLWQKEGEVPILEDNRRFTVTIFSDDLYWVDCSFELTPLLDIVIRPTNHSFFAIRTAHDLSPNGGGTLINSRGDEKMTSTFGKPASWCNCFGKRSIPGEIHEMTEITEGIALFCAPEPFRDCPWFTRDYGFFSPTPFHFLKTPWIREQGNTLCLNYRVVAYAGHPADAKLNSLWKNFVEQLS